MKGAIFDMDGTLVDSMDYWSKNFIKKMYEENISYPDDVLNIITPMGIKPCCEYMHNQLGHSKDPYTLYKEIEDDMSVEYATNIPAKPFAMEYLKKHKKCNTFEIVKKLKEQGVKMCVLSASTHKMIEASAKKCGYFDLMEFVMSCEDIGMSKSQPEIFRIVAEKMGLPIEDVTVFDDNLIAIKTAKASGAKVCAVHDQTSKEYKDEIMSIADKYIYSFEELL